MCKPCYGNIVGEIDVVAINVENYPLSPPHRLVAKLERVFGTLRAWVDQNTCHHKEGWCLVCARFIVCAPHEALSLDECMETIVVCKCLFVTAGVCCLCPQLEYSINVVSVSVVIRKALIMYIDITFSLSYLP